MFVNSVRSTRAEARALPRGDVAFVGCAECGLAWNRLFEPERLVFDPTYNPDQAGSPTFDAHFAAVADRVAAACAGLDRVDLLEVGCGQGDFLQALVDRLGARVRTARGYDPALWGGVPRFHDPRITVARRYFDDSAVATLDAAPNVVVSRHVVQHVADPGALFRALRRAMASREGAEATTPAAAMLFLETLDGAWIFDHRSTYDLFYEHCCIYDPRSIARVLRDASFGVSSVESLFSGQYMLVTAGVGPSTDTFVAPPPVARRSLLDSDRAFISEWRRRLQTARAEGPVLLWGAGAKGASFCAMVDPEALLLDGVVDIHAGKQGRFIPVTGHAIFAPSDPLVAQARLVVVCNGNYVEEIRASLASRGLTPDLRTLED